MKLTALCLGFVASLSATPALPLDAHRWHDRVLLIATPSLDDTRYQTQAALLLPTQADLAQRHIITVVALPGDANRTRFALSDDEFMVAYLGIDGGIKFARREPVLADEVVAEADRTSTRKSEVAATVRERVRHDLTAPVSVEEVRTALHLQKDSPRGLWTARAEPNPALVVETCALPTPFVVQQLATAATDEVCAFLGGDPIELLLLPPEGEAQVISLGPDYLKNDLPQTTIPAGTRYSVRAQVGGRMGWSLFGRIVPRTADTPPDANAAPAVTADLIKRYPGHDDWIQEANR